MYIYIYIYPYVDDEESGAVEGVDERCEERA